MKAVDHIDPLKEQYEKISTTLDTIGMDEVGYGSWAGPVVVCSVRFLFIPDFVFHDSKQLNPNQRKIAVDVLRTCAEWKIGIGSIEMINEHGLGSAYKYAIIRAAEFGSNAHYYIDGRSLKYLNCTGIIKGDQKIQQIAAASIMAKVFRDDLMDSLSDQYPQYGWTKNKGYGTKAHMQAIKSHGFCEHHRMNYKYKFID